MPSSPEIEQVQPFSSTAAVLFEEPDSIGGVPIVRYRVEWRIPGLDWTSKEYNPDGGEFHISLPSSFILIIYKEPLRLLRRFLKMQVRIDSALRFGFLCITFI